MKAFYIFVLIIFTSLTAIAREEIKGGSLQLASYQELERLEALEKENQHLLGRIEVAEHNIAKLEKSLSLLHQEALASSNAAGAKTVKVDSLSDIFDITSDKQAISQDNKALNNSGGNIAKDKPLYDLALASFKENKLMEAEKKFAEFLKNFPNSPLVSNAYFWYGETFSKRNMFDKAAINYLKGYKQAPKGAKASDSLLKLAVALGSLNKNQQACSILNKLDAEFPSRTISSVTRAKEAKIKFGCKN